jgi:hypothetical protein
MFVFAIIGILLIGFGANESRKRIDGHFGELTPSSKELSIGSGVVPTWISPLVLAGWISLVAGVAGGFFQMFG